MSDDSQKKKVDLSTLPSDEISKDVIRALGGRKVSETLPSLAEVVASIIFIHFPEKHWDRIIEDNKKTIKNILDVYKAEIRQENHDN